MADEPERSISKDADFELMEYQLADKVQDRILQRSKYVLGSFLAGLTLLGVFGSSFLVSQISRDVQETVRTELNNDIGRLRNRLTDNLADLSVSTKDINRTSELAKSQLDAVIVEVERLDALKKDYAELLLEVESIKLASERAFNAAMQADQNTAELRSALARSDEGAPAIINSEWEAYENGLHLELINATISGKNFGDSPGRIELQVLLFEVDYPTALSRSPWLAVDDASMRQWSDTRIELEFSDEFLNTLNPLPQEFEEALEDMDGPLYDFAYQFLVTTIDGISTAI